jgi:hypothetical protein
MRDIDNLFRYVHLTPPLKTNQEFTIKEGTEANKIYENLKKRKLDLLDNVISQVISSDDLPHSAPTRKQIADNIILTRGIDVWNPKKDSLLDQILHNTKEVISNNSQTVQSLVEASGVLSNDFPHRDFGETLKKLEITVAAYPFSNHQEQSWDTLQNAYKIFKTIDLARAGDAKLDELIDVLLNKGVRIRTNKADSKASENARKSYIRSVGNGRLLVVKQHIKSYEENEISYVENIMASESRNRDHRHLESSKENIFAESELTTNSNKELSEEDRFTLSHETEKTIEEDHRYGLKLSLSGKYGPTVEFSSNFEMQNEKQRKESSQDAMEYARNVVQRSVESIQKKVSESRTYTYLRETEEKNFHGFNNDSENHIIGVYQFLEKVYEAQVFDYGQRMMFDLVIPDPALYINSLREGLSKKNVATKLEKPKLLNINPLDIDDAPVNSDKSYVSLANRFGAEIVTPPERSITISTEHRRPGVEKQELSLASEAGTPNVLTIHKMKVPSGYAPVKGVLSYQVYTDAAEGVQINLKIGQKSKSTKPLTTAKKIPLGNKYVLFDGNLEINLADSSLGPELPMTYLDEDNEIPISIFIRESKHHSFHILIACDLLNSTYRAWQLDVFQKLKEGSKKQWEEYEIKLREQQQDDNSEEKSKGLTVPFSVRKKMILEELKKHAITLFTNEHNHDNESSIETFTINNTVTKIMNLEKVKSHGDYIRFFEHSFEWDQLQYVFYPYFWSRQREWDTRLSIDEEDLEYLEFLKAGAARLVVPVQLNFEEGILHYLETGEIWDGSGQPPLMGDDNYLSIIEEMRERSGKFGNETPFEEPWEVRIPTSLVKLRKDSDLPKWKKTEGIWDWSIDSAQ